MKITRYKKVQRFLNFYGNNFGFHQPYQILIDGTFCFTAKQEQINIKEQLPKYLVAELKLLTTKCVLIEAEKIAKKTLCALTILKQFGIHQCGHKEPINGAECLLSMVSSNSNHYFIATQDRALQKNIREICGVPLIYLHQKAPTLEKPSSASYDLAKNNQGSLLGSISSHQKKTLEVLKEKSGVSPDSTVCAKKKKRKGGPNPLSCLKKKNKPSVKSESSSGRVRKRKRIKLPAHVKEILQKM